MMVKLVMKSVTHNHALQWEKWCPCRRCAGYVLVDTSIQVWRPVVKSAWHEHSSSIWFQSHSGWLSLPGSVWLEHSSPGCQPQSRWHSLPCPIWLKHLTLYQWLSPIGLCNATLTFASPITHACAFLRFKGCILPVSSLLVRSQDF